MSPTIDHIILTRFNLPSAGVESLIRAKEGWLRDRVALFERYTIPAVAAQDIDRLVWLVYFDPASPEWLIERLRPHVVAGRFIPIYREVVGPQEVVQDAREAIESPGDVLITTNLDNDDGVSVDFLSSVQRAAEDPDRRAIYLRSGLILSPAGLFLHDDPTNAFCSVRESWSEPKTCWADWHNLLGEHMAVSTVAGPATWLQVVHGSNVSNRTRGRLVSPSQYRDRFGDLISDAPEPGPAGLIRDRVLTGPGRAVRDVGRRAVKTVIMRIGGKDGLDRLKLSLSAVRDQVNRVRRG